MKIINDTREVVTNKSFSNKATIKPSAAMFQALYSDTYSDKIGSCIRETVSNSIDSHKKANNPNPVQITLPSALTPYFRVKDNGTGIPHHTFHSLWLGYFNTTKDEDETAIGGYGVGCKSPSAYTDQYDVINIHDGVLVHHKIILDEDGIPSADIIRTHKTSEPSGIEVIIPVKDCDINEFVQKTARQICFFHPYPEVTGNASFNPVSYYSDEPYYFKETDGHGRLTLNVGGVGFPLSTNLIKSVISDSVSDDYDFLVSYANYRNKTLIINTGVNEVKPSLSRESLSFNKQTVGYLNTRLTEIAMELKKKVLHMLEDINSWSQIHNLLFDDLMFLNHMSKGAKLTFTDVNGNEQRIDKPLGFGSSCFDVFWFHAGKVRSSFKKIGDRTVLMTKINILEATNRRDINFYRQYVIEQNTDATLRDIYIMTNSEKETNGLVDRLTREGVEYSVTRKTELVGQGIVPPKRASRSKKAEGMTKQAGYYVIITKATSGVTSSNRVKMTRSEMDDVKADFLHDGSYSDVNLVKQFSMVLNNTITIVNVPVRMMDSVSKSTGIGLLSIESLTEKCKNEIEDLYEKVKYHHVMYDNLFIAMTNPDKKMITYGKVGSLVNKKFDSGTLKSVFSVYGVSHICDDAFNLIETVSPLMMRMKLSDIKLNNEVSCKTQRFDSYLIKSNPCLKIIKKMCGERMTTELGFTCETMKDVKAAIKLIEKTTASIVDNLPMVADGAMIKSVARNMDKDSVVSYIKLCANDIRSEVITSLGVEG